MTIFLASWRQGLTDAWQRRTRRERIALVVMAAIVAGALWAQLLWTTHHERQRHARLVSQLEAQVALMKGTVRAMNDARAQGKPVSPLASDQAPKLFSDSLQARGLWPLGVAAEGMDVRLAGEVPFDPWLEWLAEMHAKHGVEVLRARIEHTTQPGIVKLEAVIAPGASRR